MNKYIDLEIRIIGGGQQGKKDHVGIRVSVPPVGVGVVREVGERRGDARGVLDVDNDCRRPVGVDGAARRTAPGFGAGAACRRRSHGRAFQKFERRGCRGLDRRGDRGIAGDGVSRWNRSGEALR